MSHWLLSNPSPSFEIPVTPGIAMSQEQLSATQKRLAQTFDDEQDGGERDFVMSSSDAQPSNSSSGTDEEYEDDGSFSPEMTFGEKDDDEDYQMSKEFQLPCETTTVRSKKPSNKPHKSPSPSSSQIKRKRRETEILNRKKAESMMATISNVIHPSKTSNPRKTGRPPRSKTFEGTSPSDVEIAAPPTPSTPLVELFKKPAIVPLAAQQKPKESRSIPPRDPSLYSEPVMIQRSPVSLFEDENEVVKEIEASVHLERALATAHPLVANTRGAVAVPFTLAPDIVYLINQREVEFRELQQRCKSLLPTPMPVSSMKEGEDSTLKKVVVNLESPNATLLSSEESARERIESYQKKKPATSSSSFHFQGKHSHKSQTRIAIDRTTGKLLIKSDSRPPIDGGYMFHEDETFPAEIFPISCPASIMLKNTQRLRMLPRDEFGFMMFPGFHVVIKGYNATNIYGIDRDFDLLHDSYLYTLCKTRARSSAEDFSAREAALLEQHRVKLVTQITQKRNAMVQDIFRRWRSQGCICSCSNASCFEHNRSRPDLYVYNGAWFIDRGSYSSPCIYLQIEANEQAMNQDYLRRRQAYSGKIRKSPRPTTAGKLHRALKSASILKDHLSSQQEHHNCSEPRSTSSAQPKVDIEFIDEMLRDIRDSCHEEARVDHIRDVLEKNPVSEISICSTAIPGLPAHHEDSLEMMMVLDNPYYTALSSHLEENLYESSTSFYNHHEFVSPSLDYINSSIHDLTGGEVFYPL